MDNPNAVRMAYVRNTVNSANWNLRKRLDIANLPIGVKLIQPPP